MPLTRLLGTAQIFTKDKLDLVYSTQTIQDYSQAGQLDKSALIKTPRGTWRKPTNYSTTRYRHTGMDVHISNVVYRKSTGAFRVGKEYHGASDLGAKAVPSVPAFPLNLEGRAVNDALNALKNQKIHLGVAFGERRQTASFVTDTAEYAVKLALAVRKKDLKEVKRLLLGQKKRQRHYKNSLYEVLDAPSQLILQNAYALKPLVADTYGAVELLNDKDRADPERYATKIKSASVEQFDTVVGAVIGLDYGQHGFLVRSKGFHGCFVRLDYFIENPLLQTLTQLGVTNPLEVAWELVPFSFVADWFLPVGNYLGAINADLGLKFRGGSVSKLTRMHTFGTVSNSKDWSSSATYAVNTRHKTITGSGNAVRLTRTVLTSSPSARLPSFEDPVKLARLFNALALLTQLTMGRR